MDKGYTTLGALAAIYTMYASFSFQFLQIGKYIPELVGCLANAQNIFDFLDEVKEPANWYRENGDERVAETAQADTEEPEKTEKSTKKGTEESERQVRLWI